MTSPPQQAFDALITSFARSLKARNLAPKTVQIYTTAARKLAGWLHSECGLTDWVDVRKQHLEAWMAFLLDTTTPGHASNQYRAVQQTFKWLTVEEEIDANPMTNMFPPKLPETLVPVIAEDQLRVLFKACAGKDLIARRDLAILRLFTATGMRLAELAGLTLDDVDLDNRLAVVTGKGDRQRAVKFDAGTTMALDRYLRMRNKAKRAALPGLWLAEKNRGAMGPAGVYQMVVRRGGEIGVKLNPHQFRHTFTHRYLAAGGAEGDLMALNGWRSAQMLRRYGASAKAARAQTAYDRLSIMDGL